MSNVKPIPEGYTSVTPHLVIDGAAKAIDFYKKAFGAQEIVSMPMPGTDKLMHAEIQIGNSRVMIADEFPEMGPRRSPTALGESTVTLHQYVEDVDAAIARAAEAGATVTMPAADMFWGDRYGKVKDPFGHDWGLATHVRDLSPEEMAEAAQAAMSG
jgi:uncharacterized glyoxalase superfamily protein PhnB